MDTSLSFGARSVRGKASPTCQCSPQPHDQVISMLKSCSEEVEKSNPRAQLGGNVPEHLLVLGLATSCQRCCRAGMGCSSLPG